MKPTEEKSAIQVDVSGRTLARNTALNLAGRVTPLIVAIVTVPYVIHHLGPDRYGLLSLAWIVVGYFALFNLGIGPATTKFVAELLGKGEAGKLPELVWTALASQTLMGFAGGIALAATSPYLVERVLKIPAGLHAEAHMILLIMAALLVFDFANASMQGVLGASQRFDLLNAVSIPASSISYLLPVAVLALGFGLPAIVLALAVARLATLAVVTVLCLRLYPALRRVRFDFRLVRSLLSFGGWVTVTSIVGPILNYFDRFLIGSIVSIAAVGYYAPPYMIATKMLILPTSLVSTLFPAFSTSAGRGDGEWIRRTFVRSLKFLILMVGPAALLLVFFARPLLLLWLGPKFASEGTLVLQIMAIAAFANSLAWVPYSLLLGVGRPDIPSKVHMAELPFYLVLVWFLATRFGLPGAALAWALRSTLELAFYLVAACWLTRTPARLLAGRDLRRSLGTLAALAAGLALLWVSTHALIGEAILALALGGGFLLAAWRYVLSLEEKGQIMLLLRLAR
ncbi:MAG: flippase [Acidobacteria bacterium]|nr:MAG: flippase [Acidobacteriota bacterium]